MKEGELNIITDAVKEQVEITVKKVVNGKIDDIKEHLYRQDEQLKMMNEKIIELKPLLDGKNTIISIRKFLIWIAAPVVILYTLIEFIIDKLK